MHRFVMSRNKTEVIFNSFKAVFPLIICTTTFIYICIYIYIQMIGLAQSYLIAYINLLTYYDFLRILLFLEIWIVIKEVYICVCVCVCVCVCLHENCPQKFIKATNR